MSIRKTIGIVLGLLVMQGMMRAQDPVFSQFYMAPTQLTPAFVGNSEGPNFGLNYRNQWPSIQNAYVTYAASYDQFFPRYNSGFGVVLMADEAGDGILSSTKVALQYSYRARISQDLYLKGGLELGWVQQSLAFDQLVFFDQLDPEFGGTTPGGGQIPTSENPPDQPVLNYPDISFGMAVYSDRYFGGLVLNHLNTPRNSFYDNTDPLNSGVNMRVTVHAGAEFGASGPGSGNDGFSFSPQLMYVHQGPFRQLNIGGYGGIGIIFGGIAYRHSGQMPDAVIASVGVRTGNIRIGYSYDITVSGLGINSGGAHEVGLQYRMQRADRVNYNDCFGLFR